MSNLTVADWPEERVALLKETYAKSLNESQFKVFLELCRSQGLNPFNKEVYAMIIGGKLVQITGINGLIKIAARSGVYAGMDEIILAKDGEKIVSATCTVYKMVQGQRCPFMATVLMKEYNTGKNNWSKMPHTMICKVAKAHALRNAFPEVGSLYSEEEADTMRHDFSQSDRSRDWTKRLKEAKAEDVPAYIELEDEGDNNE